jgi:serine/threonine protein kinase
MSTTQHPSANGQADEALIAEIADDFLERHQRGERPDVEEYAARYPHLALVVREVLASLELIRPSADESRKGAEALPPGRPGLLDDFRVIREIGRGGMGVVYEAEQVSLGRRVALKVLPFSGPEDDRYLRRFQNEARAAASLQHPNIVPVYAVGRAGGVHYYAMRLIDGQTLEALIRALRERGDVGRPPESGRPRPDELTVVQPLAAATPGPDQTPTTAREQRATPACAPTSRAHFRRAAEIGAQVAEALEYAHQMGIVHRDVKPANLMVDASGHVWVTDFGLARSLADTGLTATGDVLGTLRYMSPEQALAKHGLVDHHTDVYALGATLYELLTLRPLADGKDREEVLRQIAFEDPRPRARWTGPSRWTWRRSC